MAIDLKQFQEVFFEESFEGLERMESGLLCLGSGNVDPEGINTIFRAAHSIKGGSGTFGYTQVAEFTHLVEAILDEMRNGERRSSPDLINLLLRCVDCVREMLNRLRRGEPLGESSVVELSDSLESLLDDPKPAEEAEARDVQAETVEEDECVGDQQGRGTGWQIKFRPESYIMRTGNDPLRMFRELEELGELKVEADCSKLPSWDELDPEECHLSWRLELHGGMREQIEEVFSWVEDDCELETTPLSSTAETDELPTADKDGELPPEKAPKAERSDPAGTAPSRVEVIEKSTSETSSPNQKAVAKPVGESASIRVSIDKVDALVNLVGELVITQSMLGRFNDSFDMSRISELRDGLEQLERNTRELQESIMQMRMLPIKFAFNRFPRLVHDLSAKMGKKIELQLFGEQTELDKTVMEKIGDPLVHLVRNSLDHGIESPEERLAAGKPEIGRLELDAYHEGGNIVIEIRDDGAGLDTEKILSKARDRGVVGEEEELSERAIQNLIFQPGFTTAEMVSDLSGRGVGLDVVFKNISSLGGRVEVVSRPGKGCTFTIRLPLTLAILDGQLLRVGGNIYIVPLIAIVESLQLTSERINSVAGGTDVYRLRDEYIPIVRLAEIFNVKPDSDSLENGLLVVVEMDGAKVGFFVDELLCQQQVVIKSLENNYRKVGGISGATILGSGDVALILDIPGLVQMAECNRSGIALLSADSVAA